MNFIRDLFYKIGLYKNELCDFILQNERNYEVFLKDVAILENTTVLKTSISNNKPVFNQNFEKSIEALVKALDKKK